MNFFSMEGFFAIVAIVCMAALVKVAQYLMVQVDLAIEELEESVPGFQGILYFSYVAAIVMGALAYHYGGTAPEHLRLVPKLVLSHIIPAVLLCILVIGIYIAIAIAKKVLDFLERCSVARDRRILTMQDQLEMARREASDSTKDNQARIRELKRSRDEAANNTKELQARFDKLEKTYTKTLDSIKVFSLQTQISELETKSKDLRDTISSQSDQLNASQGKYIDLEYDYNNLVVDFHILQKERSVQPQQVCQACLEGSNSVVKELEEELDCLAKDLDEANTTIFLQKQRIADFRIALPEQSTTQQVQNGEVTSNQGSLVRKSSKDKIKIAKLTHELAACEEGRKADVKALKEQIATLETKVNNLSFAQTPEPVAMTSEQQEMITNHAALTTERDRLRAERDSLLEKQSDASKDLADAKIAAQQAEEKARKSEDAARQSQEAKPIMEMERNHSEATLQQVKDNLRQTEESFHAHQLEADQLRKTVEELKETLRVQNSEELIEAVRARVDEIKDLRGKSETLQVDCKTLQENNKSLNDQKQSLEKAKESLDEEKLSLEKAHQQLQAKLQRTHAELQQSKTELQKSQADYEELQIKSSNFEKQQKRIAQSQIFKLDESVEQLLSNTSQERDNFREQGQMLKAELRRLHEVMPVKLQEMAQELAQGMAKEIEKREMDRASRRNWERDQDQERKLDYLKSNIEYRIGEVKKVSQEYKDLEQKFNNCQWELQAFKTREIERFQRYGLDFEECYRWFIENSWRNLEYMGQQRYGLANAEHLSNKERAERYKGIIDCAAREFYEMGKRSAQEPAPGVNVQMITDVDAAQDTAVAVIADENAVGSTEGDTAMDLGQDTLAIKDSAEDHAVDTNRDATVVADRMPKPAQSPSKISTWLSLVEDEPIGPGESKRRAPTAAPSTTITSRSDSPGPPRQESSGPTPSKIPQPSTADIQIEVQSTSTRAETATEVSSTAATTASTAPTTSSAAPAASGSTPSASAGPLPSSIPTGSSSLGKRRREFSELSGEDQDPDVDADDADMEGTNESNVKEDQKRRRGNNAEEDPYWKD